MSTISVPDFKGYVEIPKATFANICELLADKKGEDISKKDRYEVNKLLHGYSSTNEKPAWIADDNVANCLFWRHYIILESQS